MDLHGKSIGEFLEELSSKSPTPGGGSVAALQGAMAAALLSMVAEVTLPKKKYQQYREELKGLIQEARASRLRFLELMVEDVRAFDAVIEAMKLPKETEEQKAERGRRLKEALRKAADVPLSVAKEALSLLERMQGLHTKLYKFVVSDLGVAASTARSAVEGAVMNIIVNAVSLGDEGRDLLEASEELLSRAEELAGAVYRSVEGRLTS